MWESFGDVGFTTSKKVWREKIIKKLSAKYNGSLALDRYAIVARTGDYKNNEELSLLNHQQQVFQHHRAQWHITLRAHSAYSSAYIPVSNKNLAIANRSRVSCINTNNNTMALKSGLEVIQCH